MTEAQFYKLIGYEHAGEAHENLGTEHFQKLFEKYIKPESPKQKKALAAKSNEQKTSVAENREVYMSEFAQILKSQFHSGASDCQSLLR
jgi:hypothetical protein